MGQFGSKKKEPINPCEEEEERARKIPARRNDALFSTYLRKVREGGVIPDIFLVKESVSSQFVDEDGDVANEFYTEKVEGRSRKLIRIQENLKPKGKEKYSIPRLCSDLPIVIVELSKPN